ncbi:Xaa-Pro dipeptidase [Monaibacterium marinum]|uniref:Xaa-Pro dipeptidase n=1 Tax=Pontivivens marinum TaxID=1690039 RepID=A0A2C9CS55_9RHOB|nr:Xaa-Pro peptidase family protein [Monaibacterium marinum]SOH94186.1 Xaa-Pro dipeptidase [Monaibacterium marinum]
MIFEASEYSARRARLDAAMQARGLDAVLLFAPDSQLWLTGYDTFGFCFFQCLIYANGQTHLLTRSADLRQAQLTSDITDIRIWTDGKDDPATMLADWVAELGLTGSIGVETETHGLTAASGMRVFARLPDLVEASDMVPALRLIKSEAEITCVRRAATLCDDAFEAALPLIKPGADEGDILAAMQGAVFAGGGDYAGNSFIIGSGERALLCRYASGRRTLDARDQLTLEWAGVSSQYHVAAMQTVVVGDPRPRHAELHSAAREALLACEAAMVTGAQMRDVFAAHADVLDRVGLGAHRLNACGYSLGARYAPSWMDPQMFHAGAETVIAPGMVFFLHMILMDSETGTAMTLGRTSLTTAEGAQPLSRLPLEMFVK